jgi:hypothetical protein
MENSKIFRPNLNLPLKYISLNMNLNRLSESQMRSRTGAWEREQSGLKTQNPVLHLFGSNGVFWLDINHS